MQHTQQNPGPTGNRPALANGRAMEMARRLAGGGYLRVVNYHNTNRADIPRLQAEAAYFSQHFCPVTLADLDDFYATGIWKKSKPGLIPAIFEGYRSHYDVMAPILEQVGFRGWFYIPSYFMDVPPEQQAAFCAGHRLRQTCLGQYPDGRIALNEAEIHALAARHEICCHTATHFYLDETSAHEDMQREIVQAKHRLESAAQKPVEVFCWLGGKEYHEAPRSHPYLHRAGYRYLVSNCKIEKIG